MSGLPDTALCYHHTSSSLLLATTLRLARFDGVCLSSAPVSSLLLSDSVFRFACAAVRVATRADARVDVRVAAAIWAMGTRASSSSLLLPLLPPPPPLLLLLDAALRFPGFAGTLRLADCLFRCAAGLAMPFFLPPFWGLLGRTDMWHHRNPH